MAINADVLRADLTRTLPGREGRTETVRSIAGTVRSIACCPPRLLLAADPSPPCAVDLDQPQVSIIDDDAGVGSEKTLLSGRDCGALMVWSGDNVKLYFRAFLPDCGHDRLTQRFEREQIRKMPERAHKQQNRSS